MNTRFAIYAILIVAFIALAIAQTTSPDPWDSFSRRCQNGKLNRYVATEGPCSAGMFPVRGLRLNYEGTTYICCSRPAPVPRKPVDDGLTQEERFSKQCSSRKVRFSFYF